MRPESVPAARRHRARATAAPALALLLLTAGCVDAPAPQTQFFTTPPVSSGASPSEGAAAGASDMEGGAGVKPTDTTDQKVTGGATGPEVAVLKMVRIPNGPDYDRFIMEFNRPFGEATVGYVDELTTDPGGKPITLQFSKAILKVTVQGATLDNTSNVPDGEKKQTYAGPTSFMPRQRSVTQVIKAGDSEGTLTFGLGEQSKLPFRVQVLKDPARLVIDIAIP